MTREQTALPTEQDLASALPPLDLGITSDQQLIKTWSPIPGLYGWLATGDHKRIGKLQLVTAFLFFLLGGIEALVIRLQLARPDNTLLNADLYNQVFTMHGTTMMFLFAVPITQGFALYLIPLMIGSRAVAFPRLVTFGYYAYLLGGLILYGAFFLDMAPDTGWFSYVPLAGKDFSPSRRVDIWSQTVTLTEVAALASAVEMVGTILKMRAPGMAIHRMPLFVWAILVQSFVVIFAMPAVMTSSTMLAFDRLVETRFFDVSQGGDAVLYQHLFWFFGHPEVYLIFIPGLGIMSSIIQAFTGRLVYGYTPLVLSLITTGFLGFGLWVHHMYATGLPRLAQNFFTAASLVIALPTSVQVFCWIVSLWRGRPRFDTPLLFALGFFPVLVLGGLTGVMIASVPFDLQVHDTHFIVAHLHYVLIGGAVFPIFGGLYYWFPKFTGRMLNETLGKCNFWTMLIGFNLTFFPMHLLGLGGMPRRVYTYQSARGWEDLNLYATAGALLLFVSVALFVINFASSLRTAPEAGPNPWNAESLEWATSSPPPHFNFAAIPIVQGRAPLWERGQRMPVATGLASDRHQVLITTVLDAEAHHRENLPGATIWPALYALIVGGCLLWLVFSPWALLGLAVGSFIGLLGWFWHNEWTPGGGEGGPM